MSPVATLALLADCADEPDRVARQAVVAESGAVVLPFDLDATTHIFIATEIGGIQEVVADNPGGTMNFQRIRRQLEHEATKFSVSDSSDPELIYGGAMPGLARLQTGYEQIDVQLMTMQLGATLVSMTQDAELVDTVHRRFEAQTAGQGSHAEMDQ